MGRGQRPRQRLKVFGDFFMGKFTRENLQVISSLNLQRLVESLKPISRWLAAPTSIAERVPWST